MRTFLLAVDGSEISNRAAEHAALVQATPGAGRVLVLNVQPEPPALHVKVLGQEAATDNARKLAHEATAFAERVLTAAKVPHETVIEFGDSAETIARVARERKCDQVVIGTRGLGHLGSAMLGSVAYKVVHLTDLPVTLVR